MTNQEINKRIAELKGIDVIEIQYGWLLDKHRQSLPSWSSSISDAWELFESNPECYVKKLQTVGGEIYYTCAFRDNNLTVLGQSGEESTAPRAICMAWINWMESK